MVNGRKDESRWLFPPGHLLHLGPLTCSVPDFALFSLFSSSFSYILSSVYFALLSFCLQLIPHPVRPYIACHCCPYRYPSGFAAYFLLVRYRAESLSHHYHEETLYYLHPYSYSLFLLVHDSTTTRLIASLTAGPVQLSSSASLSDHSQTLYNNALPHPRHPA